VKLGIFGGTFDPPHLGHLILAEAAREQLGLDKVLWAVAGQSPLKRDRVISDEAARVAMVQVAIAGNAGFALSRVDLDRPAPHYTIDTLKLLGEEFPLAEFFFLMGEDSLHDLPRWRTPQDLIALTWLAVLQRPGTDTDLTELNKQVPGVAQRVKWIDAPQLEIASSDIQHRIHEGHSVRYRLPPAVIEIIEREGLYKT
jgi:nicotinate-nucleotide adenylyltransferase